MLILLSVSTPPAVLAESSGMDAFLRSLSYQVAGMLIVMGALGLLSLSVSLLSRVLRALPKPTTPVAPLAVGAPAPAASTLRPESVDEGIIAAIAAAVAVTIGRPHRVITIRSDAGAQLAWSAEGRRAIYQSHKIR